MFFKADASLTPSMHDATHICSITKHGLHNDISKVPSRRTHRVWMHNPGSMQPQQEEEAHRQPADEDCLQQPYSKSRMSQQFVPHDGTTRRRPQSAGQCRSSADTQGSRLAQSSGDMSHEARASSRLSPLRTVPEDMPAAMPAGTDRQGTSGEGRAGSLRAWRGMYSQAGTSEPATEAASVTQGSRVRQSSSRPSSAQQHKAGKGKKPSSQGQPAAIDQQQQLDRGDAVPIDVSRRTGTPPRGRSTLSEGPGPTANGFIVGLTDRERYNTIFRCCRHSDCQH